MSIYLSVVVIVFGPLLLASFIRYLSARVRRNFYKSPPLPPKRLRSEKWALPSRTGGQYWKN
jgi:hypothetical protein